MQHMPEGTYMEPQGQLQSLFWNLVVGRMPKGLILMYLHRKYVFAFT